MSDAVTLLMAIHCHQPAGNFGFVFEEAYAKAYEPFLQVLERHPGVRLSLHYSGCLLDWLIANRPEFLRRVGALVSRGQVELLASGYGEPILPLIPERDRQGQIGQMRQALRRLAGAEATGLWLTERVWEPDLPATLSRAGIRYTMVDTNQFSASRAWLPAGLQVQDEEFWDLLGCYTTEYGGEAVTLFPASKRLRYWLPFQLPSRTVEFLRRLRREPPVAITFADDGEKFGLWPKTFQWVYQEGWLDQFFSALEREGDWLRTATFSDHLDRTGPNGTVYLPTGTYEEMLEWSGGSFRNFFLKYPEANALQQKMLWVSRQLAELETPQSSLPQRRGGQGSNLKAKPPASGPQSPAGERSALLEQARRALYLGQCNCAYWHGVFGGLYLSHLRRAVYGNLLTAERALRTLAGAPPRVVRLDADGDGRTEMAIQTDAMTVVVDPDEGGAITEWSLLRPAINLLDTLTRRAEAYHGKLRRRPETVGVQAGGHPASIHDVLGVKEQHLESYLVYDDHRRSGFLDYALQRMPTLAEVVQSTWGEGRLWSAGPFEPEALPERGRRPKGLLEVGLVRQIGAGRLRKRICATGERPGLECAYAVEDLDIPVVALEFSLSLRDERYLHTPQEVPGASRFTVEEPAAGVALTLEIEPAALVYHFPIETVSGSEQGLERTYQGLALVCLWPLAGARSWSGRLRWTLEAR